MPSCKISPPMPLMAAKDMAPPSSKSIIARSAALSGPRGSGPVQNDAAAVEGLANNGGVQGVAECADADAPLVELETELRLQLGRELHDRAEV